MNWKQIVNKILGYFWLQVWQDSWLVQIIVKLYEKLVGENFYKQMQSIILQTKCVSLHAPDTVRYVRVLLDSSYTASVISLSQGLQISSDSQTMQIGGTGNRYTYKLLTPFELPVFLQKSVQDTSLQLLAGQDFIYNQSDNTIEFIHPLQEYGLSKILVSSKKGLNKYYSLWAVYYDNAALRDFFTEQMQLPQEWLYKYPGAVQAAWSIKQNGANKRDVLRLLGAIGECPYSTNSGYVRILSPNSVQIQDVIYKGKGQCLVSQGSFVEQDTKLFTGQDSSTSTDAFPAVLNYKDDLPAWLKGLHVITDVGVLFAQNKNKNTVSNVLPLVQLDNINDPYTLNTVSQQYLDLCGSLNSDSAIPYTQLPSTVNPAVFLFKKIWGPSACLIVVPPYNLKDMQKAVKFIVRNTVLGAIVLAYVYSPQESIVMYPDAGVQDEILVYYKTSISNGTSFKERQGDFKE